MKEIVQCVHFSIDNNIINMRSLNFEIRPHALFKITSLHQSFCLALDEPMILCMRRNQHVVHRIPMELRNVGWYRRIYLRPILQEHATKPTTISLLRKQPMSRNKSPSLIFIRYYQYSIWQ